jgi:hypothetical protein
MTKDLTIAGNRGYALETVEPLFYPQEADREATLKKYRATVRRIRMMSMPERIQAVGPPEDVDLAELALLVLNGYIDTSHYIANTRDENGENTWWAFVLLFLAAMQAISPNELLRTLRGAFPEYADEHEATVRKYLPAMSPARFFASVYMEDPICSPDHVLWAVGMGLMPGVWLIELHKAGHLGTPRSYIEWGEKLCTAIEKKLKIPPSPEVIKTPDKE